MCSLVKSSSHRSRVRNRTQKIRRHPLRQSSMTTKIETDMIKHKTSSDKSLKSPTDPQTTSTEFLIFLNTLQCKDDDAEKPFVFQKLLAYRDRDDSKRWSKLYENDCGSKFCATVSTFIRERKAGKNAWFGLATVPPTRWVGILKGKEDPKLGWWHAVAFGVITRIDGSGKVMIIYDCDIPYVSTLEESDSIRPRDVLRHGALLRLWNELKKKSSNMELYVIKPKLGEGNRQRCVECACKHLKTLICYGDRAFEGENDVRVKDGYYRITSR